MSIPFKAQTLTQLKDSKKAARPTITKPRTNAKVNNLFKMSEKVSVADKVEVAKITTEAFNSIRNNDKPLTEIEINYEREATTLNIHRFPRIHPRKATIGCLVRGLEGGNHQAIEYVRNSLPAYDKHKGIKALSQDDDLKALIKEFDLYDEASQMRVDCLDWLCRRFEINIAKFLDKMQAGLLDFNDRIASIRISEQKPDLALKIINYAGKEKHVADRKLAAEITGLVKPQAQVNIDNSKSENTSNNIIVPSFNDFVREKAKELGEGKKDYIDGEVVN